MAGRIDSVYKLTVAAHTVAANHANLLLAQRLNPNPVEPSKALYLSAQDRAELVELLGETGKIGEKLAQNWGDPAGINAQLVFLAANLEQISLRLGRAYDVPVEKHSDGSRIDTRVLRSIRDFNEQKLVTFSQAALRNIEYHRLDPASKGMDGRTAAQKILGNVKDLQTVGKQLGQKASAEKPLLRRASQRLPEYSPSKRANGNGHSAAQEEHISVLLSEPPVPSIVVPANGSGMVYDVGL